MLTKRHCLLIFILSIIGTLSALPYMHFLHLIPSSVSIRYLILMSIINSAFVYGIICYISYFVLPRVDIKPFNINDISKQIIYPGIFFGTLIGLIISISDKLFFKNSLLVSSTANPPVWAGILASIYGSINEEILCRLFLLTFIYFVLNKIVNDYQIYKQYIMWTSIILTSLIFAIGHLPSAYKIVQLSSFEIFRIISLNGISGIIFGWIYCEKGFWTAVMAHFVADLIIHVIFIF